MAWSTTPRRVVRLPVWIRRSSQVLMAEWSQILWGWIARWFSLYATYSCASVNAKRRHVDARFFQPQPLTAQAGLSCDTDIPSFFACTPGNCQARREVSTSDATRIASFDHFPACADRHILISRDVHWPTAVALRDKAR